VRVCANMRFSSTIYLDMLETYLPGVIFLCIHSCVHYLYVCILHVYICTEKHREIPYAHACVFMCMYAFFMTVCMCMYVFIGLYVCVCVYVYVYAYMIYTQVADLLFTDEACENVAESQSEYDPNYMST
jgi:hypothetical protein